MIREPNGVSRRASEYRDSPGGSRRSAPIARDLAPARPPPTLFRIGSRGFLPEIATIPFEEPSP